MLTPGTNLGPYEILSPLGAGGMGEVYRARDTRLGREVAVKVLPPAFAEDPGRLLRFEREARAVATLSHPNILAIFDVGTHEGTPYLVMELLEGESLRERLPKGALPPRKVVEIAAQIARGLAAAHEKGIVHRDLKPANLFLTKDGHAKILDFGLARQAAEPAPSAPSGDTTTTADGTESGLLLGTVGYMAPEQVRGQPADARSDLFAFGAVLYEMLAGRKAFRGETNSDILAAILRAEPEPLPETVPPALDRIVRHCLEKEPGARFQSARDLAFALEGASDPSRPGGSSHSPAGFRRPRKAWLAMALALCAAALAVAGGFFFGRRSAVPAQPTLRQLTFGRGLVWSARFAPDGQSIAYAASWNGRPSELFSARPDSPESRPLGFAPANLLSISSSGIMAMSLSVRTISSWDTTGTLATAALAGGGQREVMEDVHAADFGSDGRTLAVVRASGGQFRLEYPPGQVLYRTVGWIGSPRVSPEGDRVAFLDCAAPGADDGCVSLVDRRGRKRALTEHWQSLRGLAWSPGGREVWFTGAKVGASNSLYAVTPAGKVRLVLRTPGRLVLHDVSREGRLLISHDRSRYSILVKPPGGAPEVEIASLDAAIPRDISTDGRKVLFTESGEGAGERYRTYLAKSDGSPAVCLGEGNAMALTSDGAWALALVRQAPPELVLLPTGPGVPRRVPCEGIDFCSSAKLFPSEDRLIVMGREPGRGIRRYELDMATGSVRQVSPEGAATGVGAISPDGLYLAALDERENPTLYSLQGEPPRPIPGLGPDLRPIRWSSDGKFLFVGESLGARYRVSRLDLSSGRLEPWRDLAPADPAGVLDIRYCQITPDGGTVQYGCSRTLSDLYLAEGLR